jgi:hypothetical protein
MKTHRCKESLKAKISIRYTNQFQMNIQNDYDAWRLFNCIYDTDYDSIYLHHVSEIKYCPYCGAELI